MPPPQFPLPIHFLQPIAPPNIIDRSAQFRPHPRIRISKRMHLSISTTYSYTQFPVSIIIIDIDTIIHLISSPPAPPLPQLKPPNPNWLLIHTFTYIAYLYCNLLLY